MILLWIILLFARQLSQQCRDTFLILNDTNAIMIHEKVRTPFSSSHLLPAPQLSALENSSCNPQDDRAGGRLSVATTHHRLLALFSSRESSYSLIRDVSPILIVNKLCIDFWDVNFFEDTNFLCITVTHQNRHLHSTYFRATLMFPESKDALLC